MRKFLCGLIIGMICMWSIMLVYKENQDMITSPPTVFYLHEVDSESIEKEYFRRFSPEHTLDYILHNYSMGGTVYEDSWGYMSDEEKLRVVLNGLPNSQAP